MSSCKACENDFVSNVGASICADSSAESIESKSSTSDGTLGSVAVGGTLGGIVLLGIIVFLWRKKTSSIGNDNEMNTATKPYEKWMSNEENKMNGNESIQHTNPIHNQMTVTNRDMNALGTIEAGLSVKQEVKCTSRHAQISTCSQSYVISL